jgi:hypothetical protein
MVVLREIQKKESQLNKLLIQNFCKTSPFF